MKNTNKKILQEAIQLCGTQLLVALEPVRSDLK